VRQLVAEQLDRGKVDLSVAARRRRATRSRSISGAAGQYLRAARGCAKHGIGGELDVRRLLSLPGVARVVSASCPRRACAVRSPRASRRARRARGVRAAEARRSIASCGAGSSASMCSSSRSRRARATCSAPCAKRLRKRADQLREETSLLDEARLHQEIVFAADRLDITEETVRLRSTSSSSARSSTPRARRTPARLPAQEMGREVGDRVGATTRRSRIQIVELKTEVERIREQVQGVE
jgi:uncharacterized protein YicC (UPF0701 family)